MNKVIITTTLFSIILLSANIIPVSAMPWRQPPPKNETADEPIPPPLEEPVEEPIIDEPQPAALPTPTPCIPNLCLIERSSCCFSAMCVFYGEDKEGKRCPDLAGFMKRSNPISIIAKSAPSVFSSLLNRISSIFGK